MSEPKKPRNFWQILAIVAIAVAITASTLAYFEKGKIDQRVATAAAEQSKQVTKDFEQDFIDQNQTRAGQSRLSSARELKHTPHIPCNSAGVAS